MFTVPFLRRRLDPVDEQLRDISRQGSAMARLAHGCAFLLIVLFSAGSLVALSGDALSHIATTGLHPSTVPAAISVVVSTLLVTCMDVGMLYAASMLRILNARRADDSEKRLHVAVLIGACILEAGTYVYMAYQYDRPVTLAAWILVVARALAAPLFSVYLSMARPLPVGPRDILYQVELATGRGVIRDAVTVANDGGAPLERKMALFGASAVMVDADRARLENMIGVLQASVPAATQQAPELLPEKLPELMSVAPLPPSPRTPPDMPPDNPPDIDDEYDDEVDESPYVTRELPALQVVPGRRRMSRNERRQVMRLNILRSDAFDTLDGDPFMTKTQLRDVLGCNRENASNFYDEWFESRGRNLQRAALREHSEELLQEQLQQPLPLQTAHQ